MLVAIFFILQPRYYF